MRRPKGTRDLFGDELASVRHAERVMREVYERYGYEEVETPAFESLELFTRRSGQTVVKQLYAFKDKAGKELTLRPELTAPAIRLYINELRSAPKPLKLFYFGSCFRYEEPQARRWRQFLQSGVELIGSSRPESDAEVIALADDVMRELGFADRELRLGHVRLLREVLGRAGVRGEAQDRVLRAIDSCDEARLRAEFEAAGVKGRDEELLRELISLRGEGAAEGAEGLVKGLKGAEIALQNFRRILDCVRFFGVNEFSVDFGIARGLEYYTDAVFEFYVDGVQVAGGGRYDELIELLGGEPCPAVGIGFGVDRIGRLLIDRKVRVPRDRLSCMVLPVGEEVLEEAAKIAQELRASGLSTDMDLMGRSLSKAISYADARGARHVVIVGGKDLSAGKVTIRDMRTGEQELVPRESVISQLARN